MTVPASIRQKWALKQAHYVLVRWLGGVVELTPYTKDNDPCYPPADPERGGPGGQARHRP